MPPESNRVRFLRWSIVVLPPLVLLILLFVFRTWNVVWGDGVSMCPIFDKFYRSTLTFGDLWTPYQGHRVLCHRIVELLLGWITHWNVNAEIGFIYFTLLLDFGLLCWLLQDLRMFVPERAWFFLSGICSLSVFSANQVEIWTNGFNVGPALGVASALSGIVCLAKLGAGYRSLCFSLLAGTVACFSFGNGLTYWVALVPLLSTKLRHDPHWRAKGLLWMGTAGVVISFYCHQLGGNGTTVTVGESLLNIFRVPGIFVTYLFTYCGASIFFLNGNKAAGLSPVVRMLIASGAPVCGFIGVAAFAVATWCLLRRKAQTWPTIVPWVTLGLYAAFSAGLTTLARSSTFPLSAAISSRYILFTQYLWLALLVCLVLLVPGFMRTRFRFLTVILLACYLVSYVNGLRYARTISGRLREVQTELLSQPTLQTCGLINPDRDPAQVARFVEMEKQHHLATFHTALAP